SSGTSTCRGSHRELSPDFPGQGQRFVQSRPTSDGRLNLAGVPADHPVQRLMARSSSKTLVGLDIQPGYVAAVEGRSGQVAVERAESAALAPGIVRDGEVVDVETLSSVLRDMFAENKLGKRVRIGVANHRIVMRTVDLPPLETAKEIASAVRFQAQEHIPMQLDQAVLEHHSL